MPTTPTKPARKRCAERSAQAQFATIDHHEDNDDNGEAANVSYWIRILFFVRNLVALFKRARITSTATQLDRIKSSASILAVVRAHSQLTRTEWGLHISPPFVRLSHTCTLLSFSSIKFSSSIQWNICALSLFAVIRNRIMWVLRPLRSPLLPMTCTQQIQICETNAEKQMIRRMREANRIKKKHAANERYARAEDLPKITLAQRRWCQHTDLYTFEWAWLPSPHAPFTSPLRLIVGSGFGIGSSSFIIFRPKYVYE